MTTNTSSQSRPIKEKATALIGSEAAKVCPLGAGATRSLYLGGETSVAARPRARGSVSGRICDSCFKPPRRRQSLGDSRHSTAVVAVLQPACRSSLQGAFYNPKRRLPHERRKHRTAAKQAKLALVEEARLGDLKLHDLGA